MAMSDLQYALKEKSLMQMSVDNNSQEIHLFQVSQFPCFQIAAYFLLHIKSSIGLKVKSVVLLIYLVIWPVSPHLTSTACMLRQMRAFRPLVIES